MFRIDRTEAMLRLAGVTLASGSVLFAAHMLSSSEVEPSITGIQHLAIYARPAVTAQLRAQRLRPNIDYTPIGSTQSLEQQSSLTGYQLVEATPGSALIRIPEGRVVRILSGARLPGIGEIRAVELRGGEWVVVTQAGLIRER